MRPSADDMQAIAAAIGPPLGELVLDGTAEIDPYPIPGLPRTAVWRVRFEGLDHPMQVYAGLWPHGGARVLSDDQPAFADLVRAAGLEIDEPGTALGYVLGFLEATRDPSVIVRVVSDPDEIRWRPGSPDEEERREAFLADPPIGPPTVELTEDGFRIELWLVVDQRIQRNSFDVSRDGAVSAEYRVIAADLPLPIAL